MIDLTFLKNFTKGDTAKMKRYISMYLQAAPPTFERMRADLENGDLESLAINAHSLKPQTDYMGITELKAVLVQIETDAKLGRTKGLETLFKHADNLQRASAEQLEQIASELTD